MSRFHSYLTSAVNIIGSYDGSKPFGYHIKSFFAAEKKYGSRDRRSISSLCYHYFRLGQALQDLPAAERILTGVFLSENTSNELLSELRPELNKRISDSIIEKLDFLKISYRDIFPFVDKLSGEIEKELFALSFLSQPFLFLRIRPGKEKILIEKLTAAEIIFQKKEAACLQLSNNTSLDKLIKINKEAVVQDRSSQQVFNFLEKNRHYFPPDHSISVWDCCAASGGKSILLNDLLKGKLKLTVSDIRENILFNLQKRLQEAGVNIYKKIAADLEKGQAALRGEKFDLIICDAPCTGSGTWSRTPEQLYYFRENTIDLFTEKQKRIVSNVIPQLKNGGLFFYITCSVFNKENEVLVDYIKEKFHLQLLQMEFLKGYEEKADSMFVAVFTNTLLP